jgi:hypothetical protein
MKRTARARGLEVLRGSCRGPAARRVIPARAGVALRDLSRGTRSR